MKKNLHGLLAAIMILLLAGNTMAQSYTLLSPDGKTALEIAIGDSTTYSVYFNGVQIILPSSISMETESKGTFGHYASVRKVERRSVDRVVHPVIKQKSAEIHEAFNEIRIQFKGKYSLCFRVFDEGLAYRWESDLNDMITIKNETINFTFAGNHHVWFPEEESMFSHQEREYLYLPLEEITNERFSSIPVLVDIAGGPKLAITESDLQQYPGFYIRGGAGAHALAAMFPAVVTGEELKRDRDLVPTQRAGHIAYVNGERTFPWRIVGIAPDDGHLITNQMVFLLSEECRIEDPSWIRPGKVAWDWWNYNNIYKVDFEAGINTETYKHYIDFASEYGIEYIILDEGWYELGDLTKINPGIDMPALLEYGKQKNVGIILWVVWKTLDDQLGEVMPMFSEWGIAGLKVDFMQRDDQWMVEYYWRIAEEAAKRKMLVDFHGSYKPAGLHRTYPNVITREGVRGLEWNKWSDKATPEGAVTIPFIRMFAGPMDYTPGAMQNATKVDFQPHFSNPMSQGTRAHQLAEYVVFESPLQMLADNPTHYRAEAECMQFLAEVPTVWDETIVLDARVGDYVVVARRFGYQWYIGAMTDWDARDVEVDLSFLGDLKYEAVIYKDGLNAHRNARDYDRDSMIVDKNTRLKIKMAPGGGWTAVLSIVRL